MVVADINERTGPLVAEEIRASGGRAVFVRTDVTVEADVRNAVARAVTVLGGLDIGVNNAWVGGRASSKRGLPSSALDMSLEEWDFVHALLLRACFVCCQHEATAMIARGRGRIINIASISALVANASVAYCSAKAGVVSLTRRLAAEWGGHNINVNAISPSYTLSPARRTDSTEDRAAMRALHPLGWYERPDDLTGTLVYLASDAAGYVTGQNLVVDGGHTLNVWLEPRPAPPAARSSTPEDESALAAA